MNQDLTERIRKLNEVEKDLLPETKFWNQNSLFLAWAFVISIFFNSLFNLMEHIRSQASKLSQIKMSSLFIDWYFLSLFCVFIGAGVLLYMLTNRIDTTTNIKNKVLDTIIKEKNYLINEKNKNNGPERI